MTSSTSYIQQCSKYNSTIWVDSCYGEYCEWYTPEPMPKKDYGVQQYNNQSYCAAVGCWV